MGGTTSQSEPARARVPLIAADVGGTHARVALLDAGAGGSDDFAIREYRKYACADYSGLAAIIATHNLELARRMDRRVTIRDGVVVELE